MLALEFKRRNLRLTQAQVEEKTGVPQNRLSEYERGMLPSRAHLHSLASFYGVPEQAAERILLAPVPDNMADVPPAPSLDDAVRQARRG